MSSQDDNEADAKLILLKMCAIMYLPNPTQLVQIKTGKELLGGRYMARYKKKERFVIYRSYRPRS